VVVEAGYRLMHGDIIARITKSSIHLATQYFAFYPDPRHYALDTFSGKICKDRRKIKNLPYLPKMKAYPSATTEWP
jgi:hypothetical protein